MTQNRTLAEYVELAAKKNNDASGRRLAELAASAGFDVSHNTINRIRKGTYRSTPTTATLQAIAHLAGVPEADVFKADAELADADEFDQLFANWRDARSRFLDITIRYARLRGISTADASRELNEASELYDDVMKGRREWAPPWAGSGDSTKPHSGSVDVSFTERRQAEIATSEQTAARDIGTQSEGRRRREEQDRDAEHPDE